MVETQAQDEPPRADNWLQGLEIGQEYDSPLGRIVITAIRYDAEGRVTGFGAWPLHLLDRKKPKKRKRK